MGSETETILINRRTTVQHTTADNKTPITNLSSCHTDFLKKQPNSTVLSNNGNILSSSSSSASSIKLSSLPSTTVTAKLTASTISTNTVAGIAKDHKAAGHADDDDDDEDKIIPHNHNHNHMLPGNVGTDHTFKRKIVWFNAVGFLLLHMVGVAGVFTMILGYTKFATTIYCKYKYDFCINLECFNVVFCLFRGPVLFLTFASGMGITAGAHRLFSHRSYKAATWLSVTLLLLHTMAGQVNSIHANPQV